MLGYEPATIAAVTTIVLLAALVKSTLGVGFGLLATPLLLLVFDPKDVVGFAVPLILFQDVFIAVQSRGYIRWRTVAVLAGPAVLMVPVGTLLHAWLSPYALKLAISSTIIVVALLLLSGVRLRIRRDRVAGTIVGAISGLIFPISAISRPPVALFMVNQQWGVWEMRAVLSTYSVTLDTMTLLGFLVSGGITAQSMALDGLMVPALLAALLISPRILRLLSSRQYQRLVMLVVLAASGLALVSLVAGLA